MNAHRLKYVTARYPQLQGLTLMPLSLLFALSAAYRAGFFPLPGDSDPHVPGRWFMAGLGLALAGSYRIVLWYRALYGIAPQRIATSQLWAILAGIAALPIGVAIQPLVPFSAPMALIALLLGAFGVRDYPFRRHYAAAAAVLFASSLHRVLGVPAAAASPLFDLTIAAALAIAGVGDHRLLASAMTLKEAHV